MGKGAKRGTVKKSTPKREATEKSRSTGSEESLEQLMHQKEEIEALLSSLEDAYSEASILEQDYNDIKSKNETKLEEISRKIEILSKKHATAMPETEYIQEMKPTPVKISRPQVTLPVIEEIEEEEIKAPPSEEKPKRERTEKLVTSISKDDMEKLELDLAEKIKEMVEDIGAKVTEKDLNEMRNSFAKFESEIDKMKALIETVRESRRVDDEKIQRVIEGLAEVRTMVYGREVSSKEQEIRIQKLMDVFSRLEPEKILLDAGRRDKEISNQGLRINKLEETSKEFGEMLKRIEMLLRNIGSLEHVLGISNEASEKLMDMESIQRNNQKMLEKIQGIYAELSKRMEEFMLYRAKQDRIEDIMNDLIKNVDDLSTKSAYFVTKDDIESFRASIHAAAPVYTGAGGSDETKSQKEEIEMLLKIIEDEFKNRTISKEEYERMKKANLAKLKELEGKTSAKPEPAAPAGEEPKSEKKTGTEGKIKESKPGKETKKSNEMILKDLEETYKKGFISKEAYEKTKKMILGKR